MHKILVVEDDRVIAGQIQKKFESWGCEVALIQDFNEVLKEFAAFSPDLVLMDISLPFYNGFYWCAQIRTLSKIPIVFLSSASDKMNIVMAMNMGADDFVTKPFDMEVLTAKVQAVLRRSYEFAGQTVTSILEHQGAVLNLLDASLTYQGQHLELTRNELKVLEVLLRHIGTVVSRDDLMVQLWETDSFVDENTLTVNVARLRKKLELIGLGDWIVTKKGMGYLIE